MNLPDILLSESYLLRRRRFFGIFPFTFLAILFYGCSGDGESVQKPQGPPLAAQAEIARARSLTASFSTTAEILPYEQVELKAPLSGTVLAIYFREGQYVAEGTPLIKLDDRAWLAELSGVESSISSLRKELSRRNELKEFEGATQEEIDRLESQIAQLDATARQLQIQIGLANVKAPFSGTIGLRDFSVGAFLSQGTTIATLAQTQKLKAQFQVPESYSQIAQNGQVVMLHTRTDSIPASVYASSPVMDATSRMIVIRAECTPASKTDIRPGTFAEVVLKTTTEAAHVVVPNQAIIPSVENQSVLIFRNGKVVKQTVVPGSRDFTHCEILSGVMEGDTILTTGLLFLKEGAEVQIDQLIDPLNKP